MLRRTNSFTTDKQQELPPLVADYNYDYDYDSGAAHAATNKTTTMSMSMSTAHKHKHNTDRTKSNKINKIPECDVEDTHSNTERSDNDSNNNNGNNNNIPSNNKSNKGTKSVSFDPKKQKSQKSQIPAASISFYDYNPFLYVDNTYTVQQSTTSLFQQTYYGIGTSAIIHSAGKSGKWGKNGKNGKRRELAILDTQTKRDWESDYRDGNESEMQQEARMRRKQRLLQLL
uniref:Uncharacterized protein n=1 Tax=Pseudo-nitzschia australis TaxID=44445 RepID=A0A7S4AGK0_9STRA